MVRVVPPHQRLGPHDAPVGQRDQRLVVDLHLAALDDVVQRRVEVEALERARAHAVDVEEGELAAAATLLGPVHGHVGIVQEVVAGGARARSSAMPMLMVATTSWPAAERDRVAQRLQDGGRRRRRRRRARTRPRGG